MAVEFNQKAVERVLGFSKLCVQSKFPWDGKPLDLLPWQIEFIRNVYGKYEAGERLITRAALWIPKKNGKSTLLSMLCLYHLLEQPGSEVYCIAADVKQASIIFSEAARMIEGGPLSKKRDKHGNLVDSKRFKILRSRRVIEDTKGKSTFSVLSSDKHTKAGINANFIVCRLLANTDRRQTMK